MKNIKMKVSVFFVAILVSGILGVYLYNNAGGGGNNLGTDAGQTYFLVNPVFAQSASSETTFLEEENLSKVRIRNNTTFKTDISSKNLLVILFMRAQNCNSSF